jgi:hypothetical protein
MAWHPQTGAFSVIGLICARWRAIGAEQFGYPITDESTCPDKQGRYNHFRTMQTPDHPEASIYWTPETGAVEVYGGIRQHWAQLGWENSPLKYPTGPEGSTFDDVGRNQAFQNGAVSWHPQIGAFSVIGSICARWRAIGAEKFGYPITNETTCPDKHGRYNHFRTMQTPNHPRHRSTGPLKPVLSRCTEGFAIAGHGAAGRTATCTTRLSQRAIGRRGMDASSGSRAAASYGTHRSGQFSIRWCSKRNSSLVVPPRSVVGAELPLTKPAKFDGRDTRTTAVLMDTISPSPPRSPRRAE